MNDQLVDQGDALCVGESCLELVFLGQMVKQLQDEPSSILFIRLCMGFRHFHVIGCKIDAHTNSPTKY